MLFSFISYTSNMLFVFNFCSEMLDQVSHAIEYRMVSLTTCFLFFVVLLSLEPGWNIFYNVTFMLFCWFTMTPWWHSPAHIVHWRMSGLIWTNHATILASTNHGRKCHPLRIKQEQSDIITWAENPFLSFGPSFRYNGDSTILPKGFMVRVKDTWGFSINGNTIWPVSVVSGASRQGHNFISRNSVTR